MKSTTNLRDYPRSRVAAVVLAALLGGVQLDAQSCQVYGQGWGSKWDQPAWPAGAVIRWSFMTSGVTLGPNAPASWSGTNTLGTGNAGDLRAILDSQYGTGAFDAAVQRALHTWEVATGGAISFVQVADSGAPFGSFADPAHPENDPDIRIGAFSFAPGDFAGAAGFGAPGDDVNYPDPLSGDIAFNNQNNFNIDPGSEGDPLQTGAGNLYLNDLEGLLLHEIGHTLGIGHSEIGNAVMCGYQSTLYDGSNCDYTHVNRVLEPDDLQAVHYIYGPDPAANGDVYLDCRVDARDVLYTAQAINGMRYLNNAQMTHADVAPLNGGIPLPNAVLDAGDLWLIERKALGLTSGW